MVVKYPSDCRLRFAFGEAELGILELDDLLTECLPLLDVLDRESEGAFDHGLGVDRNDEAFARKVVHELCETLAFLSTKQVLRRQLYVFEEQLGSVGRVETKLLELATAAETGRVLGFDHHQRHALGTGMQICLGNDDDQAGMLAIGDEGL